MQNISSTIQWLDDPQNSIEQITDKRQLLIVFSEPKLGHIKKVFQLAANSELEMLIIFVGRNAQKLDLEAQIRHLAPGTRANIQLKAILFDQSELNFLGNIFVPQQAQMTDTYLRCESLLMSREAKAKTIPSLEIIANEVKAGHAATIGRVDDESLFYLESRGFDRKSAEELLIEAFLASAVEIFRDVSMEEKQEISNKLVKLIINE